MYYIFNEQGKCVCCCNYEPDAADVGSRNETVIFDESVYENISRLQLVEGKIVEMLLPESSHEEEVQGKAVQAKSNLRMQAVNVMMMSLAGNDMTTAKEDYQANLASIEDEVALVIPEVFPVWSANGVEYKKDERVTYNGILYKVITAHTSQKSWKPDVAPSLFVKVIVQEGEILEWEQPTAENAYKKGDRVRFKGKVYESLIDNNVWSPEAYPAGWLEIIGREDNK